MQGGTGRQLRGYTDIQVLDATVCASGESSGLGGSLVYLLSFCASRGWSSRLPLLMDVWSSSWLSDVQTFHNPSASSVTHTTSLSHSWTGAVDPQTFALCGGQHASSIPPITRWRCFLLRGKRAEPAWDVTSSPDWHATAVRELSLDIICRHRLPWKILDDIFHFSVAG